MFSAFRNVFRIPELRNRLGYTLLMLAVYRLGIFISTPGIDRAAMNAYMESREKEGGLMMLFNLFSGGALEQMSIFALGIMPYVSASIIMQLLTVVVPKLEALQKEGGPGRQKINQYTRYGTILLSIVQGLGIARAIAGLGRDPNSAMGTFDQMVVPPEIYDNPTMRAWFYFVTVVSLTAGTAFIMWLGERITERGIGNGISLIIFAGIVAGLVPNARALWTQTQKGAIEPGLLVALLALMVVVVAAVVYMERGMRRIPVQYAKRMAGRQMFAGQNTYFPMKVNTSGVIPPIFASALLSFPQFLAGWFPQLGFVQQSLFANNWIYGGIFVALIIFFCYFYTSLTFRPDDVADNIKKQGGYIPGIRPGRQTAEYIERVLNRVTFGGAIYLSVVCVLPMVLSGTTNVQLQFGGTALLIVVGVALDTVQQIEGHLISRNYEGFAGPRGPRIRGRIRVAA